MRAAKNVGLVGLGVAAAVLAGLAAPGDSRPVAVVGSRQVTWADLAGPLAEAAGGQVLEEVALGLALKDECARAGVSVGEEQVRAERALLGEQLTRTAGVEAGEAESLIERVRRSRGLGEARFRGLLERNAGLRALVRAGRGDAPVNVTAEDLATAYELKYGPRVKARMILVRSLERAAEAAARLRNGEAFADVAMTTSIDPSAERGGLLDPFSLADQNYPVGVRRALEAAPAGKVSDPIAVTWGREAGYVIVKKEGVQAADPSAPTRESAERELEREVRTVRERAQMEALARRLVRSAGVTVMDRSLDWSWETWNTPEGGR
jgi:parvulin-like peptidyl-prolyl isomerase